jgi:isoamylase
VSGSVSFGPEVLGQDETDPDAPSTLDGAAAVPRSLVVDPAFGWQDDQRPWRRYADTIIYEVHVKGFTMRHPDIPPQLRGSYAGLGHEAAIAHLSNLGVTTVELLPVHQNVPEAFLVGRGLTNYWGYNTIGFFAPHNGYSAAVRAGREGGQVAEFKAMVDALHRAGLEVVLDVVLNHTAEAGPDGPALCFRGIDNRAYYRVQPGNPGSYHDTTGCGNSLNAGDPITLQLMMDSLRYWIEDMHVDGFRFDLAPTLARQEGVFDKVSAFLDMVAQDPVVSRAKLIAEPWDVGQMDSYDLGRFPPLWREWNGKYRDTMRDFWRSHPVGIGEFANRFSGSSDLYATAGPGPPPQSTSSPFTTASPFATSSPTTTSTTRPTVRTTATGPATTGPETAVPKARRTTPMCWRCARVSPGPCSPRCCCPSACRCCSAAMRWGAPRVATTTPTARTTR